MMSRLIRAISENGGVLFCAVDSTDIVREAERIHKTSAVTSAALGRLLTAASMMGVMLKSEKDSLTLRIKGGGPSGTVLAVSDGAGNVRGYVEQPVVELPPRADGKLDVGGAVGRDGTLSVVKDLGMKEPYVGPVSYTHLDVYKRQDFENEVKRIADAYKMEVEKVRGIVPEAEVKKDLAVNKAIDFIKQNADVTVENVAPQKDEKAE